jgi:hypothetical protein
MLQNIKNLFDIFLLWVRYVSINILNIILYLMRKNNRNTLISTIAIFRNNYLHEK